MRQKGYESRVRESPFGEGELDEVLGGKVGKAKVKKLQERAISMRMRQEREMWEERIKAEFNMTEKRLKWRRQPNRQSPSYPN